MKLFSVTYTTGTERRTTLVASSSLWSAFALLMATGLEVTIESAERVSP